MRCEWTGLSVIKVKCDSAGGMVSLSRREHAFGKSNKLPATLRTTFDELGRMSLHGVTACCGFAFVFILLAACLLRCLRYELLFFVNI